MQNVKTTKTQIKPKLYLSVIIATYMRSHVIGRLLHSIEKQTLIPNEILVVDASTDNSTEVVLRSNSFHLPIKYYPVEGENKGLTRQRNFGIINCNTECNIIAFLDDDVVLEPSYFDEIVNTFYYNNSAVGVGGIDLKDCRFIQIKEGERYHSFFWYKLDGWVIKEPLRNLARKALGLMTDLPPNIIPDFSHGRSNFPPSGKLYEVEHLIGMSMSFKRELFDKIRFSNYFEGYGLYEDFDFCVRALKYGRLYVNTNAKVWHLHESTGRPNSFKFGFMVVRNGWYVWRVRYPDPSIKARFKWHATDLLLSLIRLLNAISGPNRIDSFKEFCGRSIGWISLWIKKPSANKL
jgi:GT2 family glycosyltransferase